MTRSTPSRAAAFAPAVRASALAVCAMLAVPALAQSPDAVPEKMPFDTPYGPPITLARAQAAIHAAEMEAAKRHWAMNVAVVDPGGHLLAFARMDGAQIASIAIAQHKARTAATYRRPTRVFEDAVQKHGLLYLTTLDDVIASRGGIPLIEHGHIIGAIGCSGGAGTQDEATCAAGAATVNR